MNIPTLAAFASLLGASIASTHVQGQTHTDSLSYQGTLADEGSPANGSYDFSFVAFDALSGGSEIPGAFAIVPGVQIADGLFETFVDFGTTGVVFDSTDVRWLEVRVRPAGGGGPFDVLSPRQRLTPAPLSNYALRSGTSLQDAYDNGTTIIRAPGGDPVGIRSSSPATTARLNLGSTSGTEGGGQFYLYNKDGERMFYVESDINNGGGTFASISRNDGGDAGLIVDGNAGSTQATSVTIIGPNNQIQLITGAVGDNTVVVPVDAINATEILNEVGVAETTDSGSVLLTIDQTVTDVIDTVTINCPTDGYVFVIASANLRQNHVQGTASGTNLGVSNDALGIPSNGNRSISIGSSSPSNIYLHGITAQSVFSASAGANTFYFLGDTDSAGGFAQVSGIQLSAIFIPTAYGTVSREGDQDPRDQRSTLSAPKSNYDIVMEQNAALQADNDRQQREIDSMKLQMQQLLEQSQIEHAQQTQD